MLSSKKKLTAQRGGNSEKATPVVRAENTGDGKRGDCRQRNSKGSLEVNSVPSKHDDQKRRNSPRDNRIRSPSPRTQRQPSEKQESTRQPGKSPSGKEDRPPCFSFRRGTCQKDRNCDYWHPFFLQVRQKRPVQLWRKLSLRAPSA